MKIAIIILLLPFIISPKIQIRSYSTIGIIASKIHGNVDYGVTFGNTIYLSCSTQNFLSDTPWVRHELTHIQQYKRYGKIGFLIKYIKYALVYKHSKNPLEVEAINNEKTTNQTK